MTLIGLILSIALAGFLAWLVLLIPMPQIFKQIIVAVLCVFLILYLLQDFGIATGLPHLRLR